MAWGMSPSKYTQQAIANCVRHLSEKLDNWYVIPRRADNPFPQDYRPELDRSKPLDDECSSFYQHLIGIMCWMVELGRVDIATEVSLLSSHLALPHEGHLLTALHVMGYLHLKHNSCLIFDPTYPIIDESCFSRHDWMEFYGDVHEAIPDDMPPPRGKEVVIRMMCNSDHASDKLTQRSCTGILIFINMALIDWISKRQATIETSFFGAKFVAMKHGIERLRGLWYKLCMMGVPLPGCSHTYAGNKSQVINST
jgi:hypothetical protein